MKFYIWLSTLFLSFLIVLNSVFLCMPLGNVILTMLYIIIFLGFIAIVSMLISRMLPKKILRASNPLFKCHKYEAKLYEFFGIKKWKDYVPELGKISGFSKGNIAEPKNPFYLEKFIQENCIAEFLHGLSMVLGFSSLIIFPKDTLFYTIVLPITFLATILHLLPYLIQRYMRPRLANLYSKVIAYNSRQASLLEQEEKDKTVIAK